MGDFVNRTGRVVLLCKMAFIVVCLFVIFDGRHPPAAAQSPQSSANSAAVYGLEIKSAVEDTRIDNLVKDIETIHTEDIKRMDALESTSRANALAIAEFNGDIRGLAILLTILQVATSVAGYFVQKKRGGN